MFRRISALLLCIVMIAGMLPVSAFAEEPAAPESSETMPLPEETSAPTDPVESEPPATEPATEPQQTEPTPTETPATEPVPVETEPTPTEVVITDEVMDEIIDETSSEFWQNLDPSTANVQIPDGVTYIPDRAFKDFTNLKSVYIPASVTTIEILGTYYESPFFGCSSDVVIYCESASAPASWDSNWNKYSSNSSLSVKYGWSAADYDFWMSVDKSAATIVIPDGVTFVPQDAFTDCTNLKSVVMHDSVTSLGSCAFSNCAALTDVTLSRNITSIEYGVFADCTSLTHVTIKKSTSPHQLPQPLIHEGGLVHFFAPNWARSAIFLTNLCASLGERSIGKCQELSYRVKKPHAIAWGFLFTNGLRFVDRTENFHFLFNCSFDSFETWS